MISDILRDAIPPPDARCHKGICEQSECERIAKALQLLETTWWIVTADFFEYDVIASRAYGPYLADEAHKVLRELEKEPSFCGGEALPLGKL